MVNMPHSRREFIKYAGAASGLAALAGCTGNPDGESDGGSGDSSDGGSGDSNGDSGGSSGGSSDGDSGGSQKIVTGWAGEGSAGYSVGTSLAGVIEQNSDSISIDVRATQTAENPRLLAQGELDMIYTSSLVHHHVMSEQGAYSERVVDPKPLQMYGLFPVEYFFIARSGTEIESFGDLSGKRVTIYNPSTSAWLVGKSALEAVGVYSGIDQRRMEISAVPDEFTSGNLDAIMVYTVSQNIVPGWIQELVSRMNDDEYQIVLPTDSELEKLQSAPGIIQRSYKPSGIYSNSEPPEVPLFGQLLCMYAHPELDNEVVQEFMRVTQENSDTLGEQTAFLNGWGEKGLLLDQMAEEYPFHPGAADFFEEIGWWDEDVYTEG